MVKQIVLLMLKSLIAMLLYVLAVGFGGALLMKALPAACNDMMLLNGLSAGIFGIGAMWALRRWWDRGSILSMGYGISTPAGGNHLFDILQGFLLGVALILAGLGILVAADSVRIAEVKGFADDNAGRVAVMFLTFIFIALGEESCFRGYILNNWLEGTGRFTALFVSGILFSTPHLMNPNTSVLSFVSIVLAGWLLGAAYIFTRNLWFPVGLHLGWNFTQSAVGFNVSGFENPSLLVLEYPSRSVWNGGEFGFEASVPCCILLALATAAVILYHSRRRGSQTIYKGIS